MVKQNLLPNFKKLVQKGVYGDLRSVNPPVTFPAWATMLTGKVPAKLDAFYFLKPNDKYELKLSILDWKRWNPIWNIYSKSGKKVCVFNIPTTTAYQVNGYFISGPIWGEDFDNLAYPKELNEELRKQRYLVRPLSTPNISGFDIFYEDLMKMTKTKYKLFKEYYKNFDWDIFIMSFNFGDTIQHYFWKYFDKDHPKYVPNNGFENVLKDYFILIDQYLGEIIDTLPKNSTLVMTSDHGQMKAHTYINLNAWLHQNGFLKIKNDYKALKQNRLSTALRKDLLKTLILITKSYTRIITKAKSLNRKFLLDVQGRFKTWLSIIENKVLTRHNLKNLVDWENTRAYSMVLNTIYINLNGREIKGAVPKNEYQKVRNEIIKELKKLKDPNTNKKIIKETWVKEEVYPDNPPEDFPDIYIDFHEGYINYYSELQHPNELFSNDINFSGVHTLNGIFLAYGPEIKSGMKLTNIRLEDVVPTILHLSNIPIPPDIDGRVATEIFKESSEAATRTLVKEEIKTEIKDESSKIKAIKFSKKI